MKNYQKIGVLFAVLSVGVGFAGYFFYRQAYQKPRAELAQKRAEIETQIEYGKTQAERLDAASTQFMPLYTRSFPLNPTNAALEYQIWLTQMLEFCNVKSPSVRTLGFARTAPTGSQVRQFSVQMECSLLDLTQFLYEFYWTPFLHRISVLDIQPQEGSELLRVAMTVEGLTIRWRPDAKQAFPLQDKLPLTTNPPRQLASGPFAAYSPLGDVELFRAVKTGVDDANFAILTGLPTISDENGRSVKFSRWNLTTEDRTITLKIGEELKIGSFQGTIADIYDDLVVLKQKSGRMWIVPLSQKLSEAVAVPANLF